MLMFRRLDFSYISTNIACCILIIAKYMITISVFFGIICNVAIRIQAFMPMMLTIIRPSCIPFMFVFRLNLTNMSADITSRVMLIIILVCTVSVFITVSRDRTIRIQALMPMVLAITRPFGRPLMLMNRRFRLFFIRNISVIYTPAFVFAITNFSVIDIIIIFRWISYLTIIDDIFINIRIIYIRLFRRFRLFFWNLCRLVFWLFLRLLRLVYALHLINGSRIVIVSIVAIKSLSADRQAIGELPQSISTIISALIIPLGDPLIVIA